MEPETTLAAGLALFALKDLIGKILGPTADYIGAEIKTWTEIRIKNVERIFQIAGNKLGDEIKKPGQVPPKVLKAILQEGQFCDDELLAEYFGGVLASSRTSISRDDRGASFLALIGRLSTYQIRSHYIFYFIMKKLFNGIDIKIGLAQERKKLMCFIPYSVYIKAMDFSDEEEFYVLMSHVINGLERENLVEPLAYGSAEHISKLIDKKVNKPGILVAPSFIGMELFFWVHGIGNREVTDFFKDDIFFENLAGMEIPDGAEPAKSEMDPWFGQ